MSRSWTGGAGVGTWIQSPNPEACEAAAAAGYDFCIIDMEHGTFGWDTTVHLVRATQALGAAAIVRVLGGDQRTLQKALDLGVDGVLVPKVETAAQAADIVAACRFPGRGVRGACGTTRTSTYGIHDFQSVIRRGEMLHIWGLIESGPGVENVEAILAAGLTGIVLGPFDLAFSLGFEGDTGRPAVWDAQQKVLEATKSAGADCVVSLGGTEPAALAAEMGKWREAGARTVTVPSDRAMLTAAYSRGLETCRGALQADPSNSSGTDR